MRSRLEKEIQRNPEKRYRWERLEKESQRMKYKWERLKVKIKKRKNLNINNFKFSDKIIQFFVQNMWIEWGGNMYDVFLG